MLRLISAVVNCKPRFGQLISAIQLFTFYWTFYQFDRTTIVTGRWFIPKYFIVARKEFVFEFSDFRSEVIHDSNPLLHNHCITTWHGCSIGPNDLFTAIQWLNDFCHTYNRLSTSNGPDNLWIWHCIVATNRNISQFGIECWRSSVINGYMLSDFR